MGIRESFVDRFGEAEASRIEAAAHEHENGINSGRKGTDPFKWAILICIGWQCFEKERYREHHGFVAPFADIQQWIKDHGELASHDGDCDYLALMSGAYNQYMPNEKEPV